MKWMALIAALPLCLACPSLGSVEKLDQLDQVEYDQFLRRVSSWTHVVAWGLLEEDALTIGDLDSLAEVVEGIASGTTAGATRVLYERFELAGWQGAALLGLATEADILLERRGVWGSPRAAEVLDTIASALRRAWAPPTPEARVESKTIEAEVSQ